MNILVISVHPDDETLGAGGTILKHIDEGHNVTFLLMTRIDISQGFNESQIDTHIKQKDAMIKAYGFSKVYELGFLSTQLHMIDFSMLIKKINKLIQNIKPEVVYTVNRSDVHTDHQITSKAVFSSIKSFRHPYIKKVLMYECISETEAAPQLSESVFIPNVFSDITDYFDRKIEIMKIFKSEIQDYPMPRSVENIKALAMYRGASCNKKYAEAFMLVKEIF